MIGLPGQNSVSWRLGLNKWYSRKESKAVSRMRTVQVCDSVFSNPLPRQLLASGSFTKHTLCPARTRGWKLVILDCLIQHNTLLIFAYFMLYRQSPVDWRPGISRLLSCGIYPFTSTAHIFCETFCRGFEKFVAKKQTGYASYVLRDICLIHKYLFNKTIHNMVEKQQTSRNAGGLHSHVHRTLSNFCKHNFN